MKQPLISIIVPIFNGAQYIPGLVQMIKAQTYKNLEVLLIDDGSTDATAELCEQYVGKDASFVLLKKENGGASSARNYGLRKAHGDFIAFIDADDYIFPEYLEYLYNLLLKYNADLACCEYYKMWDTEKMPQFEKNTQEIVFQTSDALENLLYRKNLIGGSCLKLYKKNILKDTYFPEEIRYGEDMLFIWNVMKRCKSVAYGGQILYIYYQHTASVTHHSTDVAPYKKAWEAHMHGILEDVLQYDCKLLNAAQAKLFILAIDYACRIWKEKDAKVFRRELLAYMKSVDASVLKDNKSRSMNRILAFLSCINAAMLVRMCRIYIWIKQILKFETRHAV